MRLKKKSGCSTKPVWCLVKHCAVYILTKWSASQRISVQPKVVWFNIWRGSPPQVYCPASRTFYPEFSNSSAECVRSIFRCRWTLRSSAALYFWRTHSCSEGGLGLNYLPGTPQYTPSLLLHFERAKGWPSTQILMFFFLKSKRPLTPPPPFWTFFPKFNLVNTKKSVI